jgi:Putative DNA-binding domain
MKPADKEALRQQMLLRALLGDARPGVVTGWLQPRQVRRGLAAYQAHAGALAERALATAYPTLQQLLGEASFAALARHYWQLHPPLAGDITLWGASLPAFIADAEALADEPYLPDVAQLEWALHRVQTAADAPAPGPTGLELLATHEPAALRLQLPAGSVVLGSNWPVFSLWQAHQRTADDRFDAVREALAAGRGEQGLVTRSGWAPQVLVLSAAEARFTAALLAGQTLAQALTEALQESGDEFDFEAWLIAALQQQRLLAVGLHNR